MQPELPQRRLCDDVLIGYEQQQIASFGVHRRQNSLHLRLIEELCDRRVYALFCAPNPRKALRAIRLYDVEQIVDFAAL